MNIPYSQYNTFSTTAKQSVVSKLNSYYSALMTTGVQNPVYNYYSPVVELINLYKTLDIIISNGSQDQSADSLCSRIVYLIQH